MSFIGFIITVLIIAYVWNKISSFFSAGTSTTANTIRIICPHCRDEVYIAHMGNWNCANCEKPFHVNEQGVVNNLDDILPPAGEYLVKLYAKLAKADGVVTNEEIRVADEFIETFLTPNNCRKKIIMNTFNAAKADHSGYRDLLRNFYNLFDDDKPILSDIISSFFVIAGVNGGIHSEQEKFIHDAIGIFQFDTNDYFHQQAEEETASTVSSVSDYEVLGCQPTDSIETIKKSYRKLLKDYHPDRYMNRDLPDDFIQLANEKTQSIHNAYKRITGERNKR